MLCLKKKSSKLFRNFKKEAQAANGFIVDPTDGQTYTVADAVEKKLVKANHANILTRAEKGATKGYEIKDADGSLKTVSFFEGLKNRENSSSKFDICKFYILSIS